MDEEDRNRLADIVMHQMDGVCVNLELPIFHAFSLLMMAQEGLRVPKRRYHSQSSEMLARTAAESLAGAVASAHPVLAEVIKRNW